MAKQDFNISFSNATISLEANEIVEYSKKDEEDTKTYVLSEIIDKLQGEGRRFSIKISESVELTPNELG